MKLSELSLLISSEFHIDNEKVYEIIYKNMHNKKNIYFSIKDISKEFNINEDIVKKCFKKIKKNIRCDEECVICMEPMKTKLLTVPHLTVCPNKHKFHSECISHTFSYQCPICKTDLILDQNTKTKVEKNIEDRKKEVIAEQQRNILEMLRVERQNARQASYNRYRIMFPYWDEGQINRMVDILHSRQL